MEVSEQFAADLIEGSEEVQALRASHKELLEALENAIGWAGLAEAMGKVKPGTDVCQWLTKGRAAVQQARRLEQ